MRLITKGLVRPSELATMSIDDVDDLNIVLELEARAMYRLQKRGEARRSGR